MSIQVKTQLTREAANELDKIATRNGLSRYAQVQQYVLAGMSAEPSGSAVSSHQRASSTRGQPEVSIVDIVPAPSGAGSSGKGSIHTTDDGGNGSILTEDPVDPLVEALRVKGLSSRSQGTVTGDGKLSLNGLIGLRSRSRSL